MIPQMTLFDLSYKASATGFIAQENKLLLNELYLGVRFKNIDTRSSALKTMLFYGIIYLPLTGVL